MLTLMNDNRVLHRLGTLFIPALRHRQGTPGFCGPLGAPGGPCWPRFSMAAVGASKATPMWAVLSAPTSFVPSPHMSVVQPAPRRLCRTNSFCSGATLANTCIRQAASATSLQHVAGCAVQALTSRNTCRCMKTAFCLVGMAALYMAWAHAGLNNHSYLAGIRGPAGVIEVCLSTMSAIRSANPRA